MWQQAPRSPRLARVATGLRGGCTTKVPGTLQPLMGDNILQYCVAIILIVTACVVLVRTVVDAATTSSPFSSCPHDDRLSTTR